MTANVLLIGAGATFGNSFLHLAKNEVKKINVPETENLALAIISC